MATGRLLNKKISMNRFVDSLSSDLSRLAFTWTLAFLDRDGKITGEPYLLRQIVFPRRRDVTDEMFEKFLGEWAAAGLVFWYEAEGERFLKFPAFRENQPNLRYEREPASSIPDPEEGQEVMKPLQEGSLSDSVPAEKEDEVNARTEQCVQNRPETIAAAEWFSAYGRATGRLVSPSAEQRNRAHDLLSRGFSLADWSAAVTDYFDPAKKEFPQWNEKTGRFEYHFGSFCSNFEMIAARAVRMSEDNHNYEPCPVCGRVGDPAVICPTCKVSPGERMDTKAVSEFREIISIKTARGG